MLLSNLDVLATAPGGVARLRELILTLAVQGKLVPQDPADEPASALLKKIRVEKDRLIAAGTIKRDKPVADVAEEEKPFELPVGWEWSKGRDLFTVVRGVTYQKDDARHTPSEKHLPILRANNIRNSVNLDELVYVPSSLVSDDQRLRLGDFVVCLASGSKNLVGKAAPFHESIDCSFGAFCGVIRPVLEMAYFAVYLASPMYRVSVSEASAGIGINNLKGSSLLNLDIALPPLAEQSRIVARVEELMRLCDALEAKGQLEATQHAQLVNTLLGQLIASSTPDELHDNWQRVAQHFDLLLDRPAAVDALEQTILQLAVRGLLTQNDPLESDVPTTSTAKQPTSFPFDIPPSWQWLRLGDVVTLINGDRGTNYPNKAEYVFAGVPFINTGHIDPDGSLSSDRMNFLTREKFDSLRSGKVQKGDLVYCLRGATLGKTAVVEYEEGAIASSLVIVRPSSNLDKNFAFLYLTSPFGRSFIWQHDNGSAQPNLAAGSLMKYWIPLPPLVEQSRLVARVASLRRLCADLRQRLAARQTTQAHLAEALVNEVA